MLISIVFLLILNPVLSLQGTLSENKNVTTKSKNHTISHNVLKLVTTTLTTKVKIQKSTNQTLPSTLKLVVDGVQKPVPSLQDTLSENTNSTTKSKENTINLNVQKPVTTLSNAKTKNQSRSTSSKTSSISQTLSSTTKPTVDIVQNSGPALPGKPNEKKNSTAKTTAHAGSLNLPKLGTIVLNTKLKNQTHTTSSKNSNVNQTLPSTTKPTVDIVQNSGLALPGKPNEKKNSTAKTTAHAGSLNLPKLGTIVLNTKLKNQTHTTSSKKSNINQTLPSTTKLVADEIILSTKKNSTVKSTVQTININVSKKVARLLNTKTRKQTQSTSSKISNVNQHQDQKHVPSLQDALSEKKNSTVTSTAKTIKVVTTLLKTKIKDQTQPISSKTSRMNQTLSPSTKPDVDTIHKPVQSVQNTVSEKKNYTTKSTVNSVNVNAEKPVTTLLKTKMKDQTQSTSSTTSRVNQTLPSSTKPDVETILKPVQSEQNTVSETKNYTTKATVNSVNVNAKKPVTTLQKTKIKDQTQSTSSKNSTTDQTLLSSLKPAAVQKPVSSLPATENAKKNTSTKLVGHIIHVNASKSVNTKIINQTYSASSKPSRVGQTLLSTPKPVVDVQKPGPSLQGTVSEKKNSTSKLATQTISHNVPKLTTLVNTKIKNQTHLTSSETSSINQTILSSSKLNVAESTLSKKKNSTVKSISKHIIVNPLKTLTTSLNQTQSTSSNIRNVNQTVASTTKPLVDRVQNPSKDKPAESSPFKVVITEGCVPRQSQTDSGNVNKVQETELSLNLGSPLVMTHHINLVQGACTGSCETEMATLRDRVEFLEKEMAAIKKMCK